jgi:Family of unknown function (DUF6447)
MMTSVTVDGRDYDLAKLNEEARRQALNILAVDEEIRRLQMRLAICQTARNAYASALQAALPKDQ